MPLPPSPRAELVRAAVHAAAAVAGQAVTALVVTVAAVGVEVEVRVSAEEVRAVLGPAAVEGLSPVAQAIYRVLTLEPQTAKTLARMAGYHVNPHFRGGLRELRRRDPPLCVQTPEGYRRA